MHMQWSQRAWTWRVWKPGYQYYCHLHPPKTLHVAKPKNLPLEKWDWTRTILTYPTPEILLRSCDDLDFTKMRLHPTILAQPTNNFAQIYHATAFSSSSSSSPLSSSSSSSSSGQLRKLVLCERWQFLLLLLQVFICINTREWCGCWCGCGWLWRFWGAT